MDEPVEHLPGEGAFTRMSGLEVTHRAEAHVLRLLCGLHPGQLGQWSCEVTYRPGGDLCKQPSCLRVSLFSALL